MGVATKEMQDNAEVIAPDDEDAQDILLGELLGGVNNCHRWQIVWSFILPMFQLITSCNLFIFSFQTLPKDFWCNTNSTSNVTMNSCTVPSIDGTTDIQCTDFRFADDGSGSRTLVEEFQLVCDRQHYLTFAETSFLAGVAIGSITSGWFSDRFGRKHTLMIFASIQLILANVLAFAPSLPMFMTLRVVIGFTSVTVSTVSFVLVIELVSGKWRTIIGILDIIPMSVAYIASGGIAYYIRDWRTLQLVISVPFLALLFIWYCVPESPRWLLVNGSLDRLCALLERAAKFDGRQLPANYRKTLEAVATPSQKNVNSVETAEPTGQLPTNETPNITQNNLPLSKPTRKRDPMLMALSGKYLRRTFLSVVTWFMLITLYFGLTLHLGNLGGNIYLNTMVVGGAELISVITGSLIAMQVGMRPCVIGYMVIPGIACLLVNVIPQDSSYGVIILAMIAKCIIGIDNTIVPTFTASLYPTEMRNVGIGFANLASGIALVLVPFLWLLEDISPVLPLNIMGACGLIGGVSCWLLKDGQQ